jgi:hypothetical protein
MKKTTTTLLVLGLMLVTVLGSAKAATPAAMAGASTVMTSYGSGKGNTMTSLGMSGLKSGASSRLMLGSALGNERMDDPPSVTPARIVTAAGRKSAPMVPELASMLMFGSGLMVLGGVLRRRNPELDPSGQGARLAAKPVEENSAIPDASSGFVRNG